MKRLALALALFSSAAPAAPSRIFIASDSTAQTYAADRYPQQGWGAFLQCALDKEVTVENRAIAARSTRSFINEGRLDKIAQDIRVGDSLLIQFGHNDQNKAKPERYASVPDYKMFLRRYIDVARKAGAQAVLLTPVTQRKFVDGHVVASFPDYSGAVREVARETRTPLIDLEQLSGRWVERAGPEASKAYFLYYPYGAVPGFPAAVADETHFSELGARGVADIVAGGLAGLKLPVSRHVLRERPALTRATPLGSSACEADVRRVTFRFAGPKVAGATDIAAGQAYDGRFGFEPGAPTRFSVAVPEGNYRVTARLGGAPSETTFLAESRRLMLDRVKSGKAVVTRSFVVNVRQPGLVPPPENAPGLPAVILPKGEDKSYTWDNKLTLTIGGARPRLLSLRVEPVSVPTVFLMGDSTVTDQGRPPFASWGQMLPVFFGPDVAVANDAKSGETMKSFLAEGRLNKVLSRMKPGDYALIQFGHNDQKTAWPQTYVSAASTYRAYLAAYIAEVRLRGATPILVTSPERGSFKDGKVQPSLADYAKAVREVAAEQNVPLIDLNAESILLYEALGAEKTKLLFGAPAQEMTHHSPPGAYRLARSVAEGLARTELPIARLLALPSSGGGIDVPVIDPVMNEVKAEGQ
ncbi:MAG: rhamnogalacturonan acetylesterase [Sphingomicrobium sp.]